MSQVVAGLDPTKAFPHVLQSHLQDNAQDEAGKIPFGDEVREDQKNKDIPYTHLLLPLFAAVEESLWLARPEQPCISAVPSPTSWSLVAFFSQSVAQINPRKALPFKKVKG